MRFSLIAWRVGVCWPLTIGSVACGAVVETRPEVSADGSDTRGGGMSPARDGGSPRPDATRDGPAVRDMDAAMLGTDGRPREAEARDSNSADARCPASRPFNLETCVLSPGTKCSYPAERLTCTCDLGQPSEWSCSAACPVQQPQPGDPCSSESCVYGNVRCDCALSHGSDVFFCN